MRNLNCGAPIAADCFRHKNASQVVAIGGNVRVIRTLEEWNAPRKKSQGRSTVALPWDPLDKEWQAM